MLTQDRELFQLISEDKKPAEVARLLGVHRATLYRALERNDVNTH